MAYSLVALLILVLDIYVIYLIVTSSAETGMKLLWVIVVLVLPVVGPILYLLLGRAARA